MNINELMTFSPFCHICEHLGQNRGMFLKFLAAAIAKELPTSLQLLDYVVAKCFLGMYLD